MPFFVRVRCRSGMKRLQFDSNQSTFADLQKQILSLTNTPIDAQLYSTQPLNDAQYLQPQPTATLASLGLKNGDILYLAGEADNSDNTAICNAKASTSTQLKTDSSSPPPATTQRQLTPNCRHGPGAACSYCAGVKPGEDIKTILTGKCNHPSSATCIHCSAHVKDVTAEPATWLCNHPDTVFCPKCLPPEEDELKTQLKCSCDQSKGQQCTKCVHRPPVIKVDKIPFARFLSDKRALCKFKHSNTVTCAFCATPIFPSFAAKPNCNRHAPGGVCLTCAPPNCIMRVQEYRHCDSVSIDGQMLFNWYSNWIRKNSASNPKQRACILFGRYIDEPSETNNPGAIRALVDAIYEPPQDNTANSIRFLKDDNEANCHLIAGHCGLQAVGWVVGTMPRSGKKYGGKVLMSGLEVQQAARFQYKYRKANGYSQFVTIVIEHATQVEPVAYQIADAAVALEHDGYLAPAADPYMLSTRLPGKGEMVPTIVYKDRPLQPGTEFLPDEMLVKVAVTAPRQNSNDQLFKSNKFPFTAQAYSETAVRNYLRAKANEDYESKLSDFNLLVCLINMIGAKAVAGICDAIRQRNNIANHIKEELDRKFIEKDFF